MLYALKSVIIGLLLTTAGWLGYQAPSPQPAPTQISIEDILGAYNPSGGGTYRLQSSIASSDTSISLSSFKEPVSNIAYTMSYLNSSIEYGTLEPSNTTKKEFISFSGITQNSDGTATLTGVTRGLAFSYPYTASTTLQQSHSGQSIFILSNPPQLTNQYANKSNTETISGLWTFPSSNIPVYDAAPTFSTGLQIVDKTYVDNVSFGGVATATELLGGRLKIATQQEMASTTYSGVNDAFALTSHYSTSTRPAGCNGATNPICKYAVITQNDGYIDNTFLNFTTGITINGQTLAYPSSAGTASTTLVNDGSNNLSWQGFNKTISAPNSISLTTASSSLTNYLFSANTLGIGDVIRVEGNATTSGGFSNQNVWNLNLSLGGKATSTCGIFASDYAGRATSTIKMTIKIVSATQASYNCEMVSVKSDIATGAFSQDKNVPGKTVNAVTEPRDWASGNAVIDITSAQKLILEGIANTTSFGSIFNVTVDWLNL